MREKAGCLTLFAFFAKGWETTTVSIMGLPRQLNSRFLDCADRFTIRFARNDRSNEGAPSLRLRSGQALVSLFLARQGGDFDFIGPVREVKIPTLPHRTREGWGTRVC